MACLMRLFVRRLRDRNCKLDATLWTPGRETHMPGSYGENVYGDFKDFHDKRYGSFSELMRMPFDDACAFFNDGTIDLLHIDGYHTHKAVSHDFETWRPKLSERAVVLFHDTNVRAGDFGVWRFFGELREQLPSFEFLHCHGLGVVAVGVNAPDAVRKLCKLDSRNVSLMRERFSHVGARWSDAVERGELGRRLGNVSLELQELRSAHVRTVADHETTVAWAKSMDKELSDLRSVHARTVADHETTVAWAKSMDKELSDLRGVHARTVADHESTIGRVKSLDKELE